MKKVIFLLFLLFFSVINIVLVSGIIQEYTSFDNIKNYNPVCTATSTAGVTVQNASCTYQNNTFFDNNTLQTNLYIWKDGGNFIGYINITLDSLMPNANKIQLGSEVLEENSPGKIQFYFCNNADCSQSYLWENPLNNTCQALGEGGVFNFSWTNITLPTNITDFNKVKMYAYPKNCLNWTTVREDFTELNISYVGYMTNNLPILNITLQNFSICLNNETVTIPVNISAYDPENDTILYATQTQNTQSQTREINFNRKECLFSLLSGLLPCPNLPDYSKYDELNTGCHISQDYNSTTFNLVPRADRFNNTIWILELNDNCNPAFFYNDINAVTGLYVHFDLWDIDNINLTINKEDLSEILNLNLVKNGSNIDLIQNNTILSSIAFTSYIGLILRPSQDHYEIELDNSYSKTLVNVTSNPFTNIASFIGFTGSGKVQRFFYSSNSLTPVFTTVKPIEMVISELGYNYLTFFVTDNMNTGNYSIYTVPIYVYETDLCNYAVNNENAVGKSSNPVLNTDILGSIKGWFGVSFKDYLVRMNYYDMGQNILWFIFIILFLILLVSSGFLFGHFDIMFPLLIDSLAVGFVAFMVDYTTIFVSMLIILAFALAIPITKALGSGQQGVRR